MNCQRQILLVLTFSVKRTERSTYPDSWQSWWWRCCLDVDLIHYIYDFKHYICNSKQSFCQIDDSKHSILWPLWRRLKNCGHCTSWMMYRQIHNQTVVFISRKDALYQVVLYLFQIRNVLPHNSHTATLFCLRVTAAKETKELFIISIIFKIILIIVSRI